MCVNANSYSAPQQIVECVRDSLLSMLTDLFVIKCCTGELIDDRVIRTCDADVSNHSIVDANCQFRFDLNKCVLAIVKVLFVLVCAILYSNMFYLLTILIIVEYTTITTVYIAPDSSCRYIWVIWNYRLPFDECFSVCQCTCVEKSSKSRILVMNGTVLCT